jgi:D-alanyl-D-alanine carboxypeptidase
MTLFRTAALAVLLFATACQTPAPTSRALVPQALDASLLAAAERSGAPGLVGAIYRDGEIVELFAWGGFDCAGAGEADPHAAFEIGSISKHTVSVAIMQLVEQGRLELEAPLGRYLNDIPEAWRGVTVRQLLTHTSGVPDYEAVGTGYRIYETTPTPAQVYALVDDQPLDFEPGTRWNYSNTGFFLLSQVVQRVSSEAFGAYQRAHLFEPANAEAMFMSGYGPEGVRLAQGCRPGESEGAARIDVRPITEASTFGAGGVTATLESFGRWDHALHSERVVSAESLAQIYTAATLSDGSSTGYGFGMEVDDFRGERRFGHSGQTQGFVADYARFPDRGVAILVMANTYGGNPSAFMQQLILRVMPDLSYDALTAPVDPDPVRSEQVRRAVRQVILVEEPLDLLHADMEGFARNAEAAPQRARLHDVVANAERVEFLRVEPQPNSDERYLYRYITAGETHYFTVVWRAGQLYRLRYEER